MTNAQSIQFEIEQILFRWAWLVDHGPHDQIASLFTDNGTFDMPGTLWKGREELQIGFSRRSATRTSRHVISNIRVRMEGVARALVTGLQTVYRHDGPPPHPSLAVSVFDIDHIFERDDEKWRMETLRLTRRFVAPAQ